MPHSRKVVAAAMILGFIAAASASSGRPGGAGYGTITGRVAAADTDTALAFANVVIAGTQRGAMTDSTGRFVIRDVPPGRYTIKVMMMGYKTVELRNVTVTAGQATEICVCLEVTITATTKAIEVEGTRRAIQVRSSSDRSSNASHQIKEMPVEVGADAIARGIGVVGPTEGLHARGGRSESVRGLAGIRRRSGPFTTETYDRIYENEFLPVVDNPVSTFSIDVDAASYSNVRRFISRQMLPPPDAVRIEELINYFHYDYPEPDDAHPFSITAEIAPCPWNDKNQIVHIGLQGRRVALEDLPPNNIVFLIDVSGSMQPPNKLPLLKKAFRLLTDQLRPDDRVAIVVYAGASGLVLPSTPGDHKAAILGAIGRLQAGGTTAGAAGIRLAYRIAAENFLADGNNRVILATDGDFNVGVSSDGELVRLIEEKRKSGVFLTVLGFGTGNLRGSRMEKLADKGNGHYAYIDNVLEAKKVLVEELGATLLTIAKDVKIQIEFNPAKVASYRLIGYENRLLEREDFEDDKKDAGELGAGHSVTALYEIVPAAPGQRAAGGGPYRYMQVRVDPDAYKSAEILTVRFRYKMPEEDKSRLIVRRVRESTGEFDRASTNLRFSAAVAEFGMLLRDSEFKGDSSFEDVLRIAKSARGADREGYRAEFIRLVETCALLSGK